MAKKLFGKVLPLLLVACMLLSTTVFAASTYYIEVSITGPNAEGLRCTVTDVSSKYGSMKSSLAAEVVQVINDEVNELREAYLGTALGPIVYAGLEAFANGEKAWDAYHDEHFEEVTGGFKEILSDMDSTFADLTVNEPNVISYLTEFDTVYTVTITLKEYDLDYGFHGHKGPVVTVEESTPAQGLLDVDPQAWYYDGVRYCMEKGIMEGYSANRFGTDDNLTRAQVAQILYNLKSKPAVEPAKLFDDVALTDWHAAAVTWASEAEVVKGYGNGKFGPNDPVTREQLAAMLYRYSESNGFDVSAQKALDGFADAAAVSAWAKSAVQWAYAQGILTGVGNRMIAPGGLATRAQAATMLMRYCQIMAG